MEKHVFWFALVITAIIAGAVFLLAPGAADRTAETASPHHPIPRPPEYQPPAVSQPRPNKTSAVTADMYKWVDEKGVVHFSDSPDTADAKAVHLPPLNELSIPRRTQAMIDVQRRQEVAAYLMNSSPPAAVLKVATRQSSDYLVERASAEQHMDYVKFTGRISGGPPCKKLAVMIYARNEQGKPISAQTSVDHAGGDFGSQLFEVSVGHKWKRTTPRDIWTINRIDFTCREAI
jgi:Domain of unknown function (DUF4124)